MNLIDDFLTYISFSIAIVVNVWLTMVVLHLLYIHLFLATFVYGIDSKFPHTFYDIQSPTKIKEEEFNALEDLSSTIQKDDQDIFSYYQDYDAHNKKSDFKPKYDPGWKFIGLGKRPLHQDFANSNGAGPSSKKLNPLWGISTLVNFEFFNALKEGLGNEENQEKEPVKKGEGMIGANGISALDSGNHRFHKAGWYGGGRQKNMYDPGWMLTGLGK